MKVAFASFVGLMDHTIRLCAQDTLVKRLSADVQAGSEPWNPPFPLMKRAPWGVHG